MVAVVALRSHPRSSALWVGLVSAGGFVALALAAIALPLVPGDEVVRQWLLSVASPPVVEALRVLNYAGSWRLLLPATLLILVASPRARNRWWIWIGLMLAAPGAEGLMKILIGRARPEEASMGFPSGHAMASLVAYGMLVYLLTVLVPGLGRRRLAIVAGCAALLILAIGWSRIYLGVHHFSDVIAGYAAGVLWLSAGISGVEVARRSQVLRS